MQYSRFGCTIAGMRSAPLATQVFATIGAVLLTVAVILGVFGSFAYLAAAAVGLCFVAAALISRAIDSPVARGSAFLALIGLMLALFGTVTTTPILYLGLGLMAAAAAIGVLFAVRTRKSQN
jgi:hypothetical protein